MKDALGLDRKSTASATSWGVPFLFMGAMSTPGESSGMPAVKGVLQCQRWALANGSLLVYSLDDARTDAVDPDVVRGVLYAISSCTSGRVLTRGLLTSMASDFVRLTIAVFDAL